MTVRNVDPMPSFADVGAVCTDHKDALAKRPFRAPLNPDNGNRGFHAIHGPFLFFVEHGISETA